MLGAQPPFPGEGHVLVKYTTPAEESNERTLVPTSYYGESRGYNHQNYSAYEERPPTEGWALGKGDVSDPTREGPHAWEQQQSIMFIAPGGPKPRPSYPQRPYANAPMP